MAEHRNLDRLLRDLHSNVALVIGNGINMYGGAESNSWVQLLLMIAHHCNVDIDTVPKGTALTEFYDVLELQTRSTRAPDEDPKVTLSLQSQFCELMKEWKPLRHHTRIMDWAVRHEVPVLTTNFEEVLSEGAGCGFIRPTDRSFSDYYPWECRFAHEMHVDPCAGFGIWHINGMRRYRRSIRLGLSHYMGSVQRARTWLHRGDANLFSAKNRPNWDGARSWVHLVFNKPLLIFGLGLGESEVFLRWLLIERAKYFRKFPGREHPAWYVYTHDPKDEGEKGKHFFLEGIGINCVRAHDYTEIYANDGWSK